MGKRCTYTQDYSLRFNHEDMLRILQQGLLSIERLINAVEPEVFLIFEPVTFGDYLFYLFAKSKGIPILNLRPTRIKNYITFSSSIFDPCPHIYKEYQKYETQGITDCWKRKAEDYLKSTMLTHAMYEGVIPISKEGKRIEKGHIKFYASLFNLLKHEYNYLFSESRSDNHIPGIFIPAFYKNIINPLKAKLINYQLSKEYIEEDMLQDINYAFYPLHTEPEISLLVRSRPYLNQIEVIRNFAQNIPVGMKLVVKEHPASIGKRPISYYRKILEIPNVHLSNPYIESRALIKNAKLILLISGSIGFEGILLHKPVVCLSNTPFEILPDSMVRSVRNLNRLGIEIAELMKNYEYQEEAVVNYIGATMSQSVPVNLYSRLLGKKGVWSEDQPNSRSSSNGKENEDIERLAEYTIKRVMEVCFNGSIP
jgi:hypothetical protein